MNECDPTTGRALKFLSSEEVSRDAYGGCRGQPEVVHIRIEGGGQHWLSGELNREIDASEAIWQFFAEHGR